MSESKFFCFGKNDFCDDAFKDKACEKCRHMDGHGGEMRTVPKSPRFDRSAWEPCEQCRNGNTIIDIPACDQFGLIHNGKSNEQMHFLFQFPFCPYCGRPLTDAAWDALENRLEGTE